MRVDKLNMPRSAVSLVLLLHAAQGAIVSVTLENGACVIHPDEFLTNAAAVGIFNAEQNSTGSDFLWIRGQRDDLYDSLGISYAMGCAEAYLTHDSIFAYWSNYAANEYGPAGPSPQLKSFMTTQMEWARSQVAAQNATVPFWSAAGLFFSQFDGLRDGYTASASPGESMTELQLYMLNSVGDLEDLDGLFPNRPGADGEVFVGATEAARAEMVAEARKQSLEDYYKHLSHDPIPTEDKLTDCSGLIRLIGSPSNVTDVYVGHTTWRHYYAMLRTYKVYTYPQSIFPVGTISFSSSPGLLHSKDDFYATDSLVVMETTNSVMNSTLWGALTPNSLLSWQRAQIANALAQTGEQWASFFNRYSSGTYSNQWMILDLTVLNLGGPLPNSGLLWITESVPGYQASLDVTSVFKQQGYWPSYNIPFIPLIYNVSGYPAYLSKYGNEYSYTLNSRAQIFARNVSQGDADTFEGMRLLMRYNDFQNDPLSGGDAVLGSISSRADLLTNSPPKPFGGVDTKVVAASMISPSSRRSGTPTINVYAEFGPTHDQQAEFSWSSHPEWTNQHLLTPNLFNFTFALTGTLPTGVDSWDAAEAAGKL